MKGVYRLVFSLVLSSLIASLAFAAEPQKNDSLSILPLADQVAISRAIGKDSSAFLAHAAPGKIEMQSAAGTLKAIFTADGIRFSSSADDWRLQLTGYGRAQQIVTAKRVTPSAQANRVEYRRGTLTEWYENGPSGLEQGFTLDRRVRCGQHGDLTIALALSGNLTAVVDQDGHGLRLVDHAKRTRLRYSELQAYDVNHQDLPATMAIDGNRLLIRVDDRHAKYPIVVDPIVQLAELTASDGKSDDALGFSVSVNGDTVAVGAPSAVVGSHQGAVYVFVKPTSGWTNETQAAKLTTSDDVLADQFGWSVAVQGNTVVAGAPNICTLNQPGRAYVFVKPASGWTDMTQTAELTSTDGACFGYSVGIDGNTIVVGAQATSSTLQDAGAAYVYVKPTGGWINMTQTAKLTASDPVAGNDLGYAVGISGNTIVASAPYARENLFGKIYVYEQPSGGWTDATENAQLTASNTENLALSLAISGDTVVSGDPDNGDGAAYVYVMPSGGWVTTSTPDAVLTASDATGRIQFGWSVGVSGKHIVVGANKNRSFRGTAYLYTEPAGGWVTTSHFNAELHATDGAPGAQFGISVAINGSTIVVGADDQTVGGNAFQGAAYVF